MRGRFSLSAYMCASLVLLVASAVAMNEPTSPVVESLLLRCSSERSQGLERAIKRDDTAEVKRLLRAGADPNAGTMLGLPLHLFVEYECDEKIGRRLIAAGADVKRVAGWESVTPLHTAVRMGPQVAAVEMLLQAGADSDARDRHGRTPLHRLSRTMLKRSSARSYDTAEVVSILKKYGADVNARDHAGETPVHATVTPDALRALLAAGADGNAQDNRGRTPVHVVSKSRVLCELCKQGASLEIQDRDGRTPLAYLARGLEDIRGEIDMTFTRVRVLIELGAHLQEHESMLTRYAWW